MDESFDRTNIDWPLEIVARPVDDVNSEELLQLIKEISADHANFSAILSSDSPAILIGGCDERQLKESVSLLRNGIHGDIDAGATQIGYRETFSKPVEIDHTHKKRSFGDNQYARLVIVVEPLEENFGFEFDKDGKLITKHRND